MRNEKKEMGNGKWETGNGKWEREREREREKLPRVKGIRIRGLWRGERRIEKGYNGKRGGKKGVRKKIKEKGLRRMRSCFSFRVSIVFLPSCSRFCMCNCLLLRFFVRMGKEVNFWKNGKYCSCCIAPENPDT